ncbi:MAG: hypothetical protein HC921_22020, partial [Synechococcaceae cyanobacterium SM2_3_1]|nr:hypothetical protein [Synechococcaceae cyanobacterium SM2_3_1]
RLILPHQLQQLLPHQRQQLLPHPPLLPTPTATPTPIPTPTPTPSGSGIQLSPAVSLTAAGRLQISVQISPSQLATTSFTIPGEIVLIPGSDPIFALARFVRSSIEFFPGFSTYSADALSGTVQVTFNQVEIAGVSPSTCVIVHEPALDPLVPANQIAKSSACS